MGRISSKIENIYNALSEDSVLEISDDIVKAAMKVLRNYRIYNTKGLFYYLTAVNLLNAAIKRKEYKNKLRYSFIKGKVAVIVEYVIRRYTLYNVNYYYSESESCIYRKVYDVVFSFHNIPTEILEYEDVGKQKKDRMVRYKIAKNSSTLVFTSIWIDRRNFKTVKQKTYDTYTAVRHTIDQESEPSIQQYDGNL